jgi:hypothetical protein
MEVTNYRGITSGPLVLNIGFVLYITYSSTAEEREVPCGNHDLI